MSVRTPAIVFLGPTLKVKDAETMAEAIYLPPAAQGSIMRAVERHHPRTILIIDGVFQSEPAVRHKEILWALAQGILVLGAASMGALRAAELHSFGMIGVGLIYRWFRRHDFTPDDAVAVVHGPPELGSPAMTLSLIDLLMTVRRAQRLGRLDRDERFRLEKAARNLNFRDRTLANMVAAAGTATVIADLEAHLVEQKKNDAASALRCLAKVNSAPLGKAGDFIWTTAFIRDLEHARITIPS